jgi:hypothetical protein
MKAETECVLCNSLKIQLLKARWALERCSELLEDLGHAEHDIDDDGYHDVHCMVCQIEDALGVIDGEL